MTNPRFDEDVVTYEDFKEILRNRELECLCLKCEGKSNKEIGLALTISEFVARNYITAIFNKTGIRSSVVLCQRLVVSQKRSNWIVRERKKRIPVIDTTNINVDLDESYHTMVVTPR